MPQKEISSGTAHTVPNDLRKSLLSSPKALSAWNDITPLARNEWICWVQSVKKKETRDHHIRRAIAELAGGKRRPCCWVGCVHRTDKSVSASQKYVLSRETKKR